MHNITLAQTVLTVRNLRIGALWAELDAGMRALSATVLVHSGSARDYRLPSLDLQVRVEADTVTVSWVSSSPVIDFPARQQLRQSADAWLHALAALMLCPAPVSARVQAAQPLLSAGFESVAVSNSGDALQAMAA